MKDEEARGGNQQGLSSRYNAACINYIQYISMYVCCHVLVSSNLKDDAFFLLCLFYQLVNSMPFSMHTILQLVCLCAYLLTFDTRKC